MRKMSERKIKVDKKKLIRQIEDNKTLHITEFNKAIVAYKEEAKKQLEKNLKRITKKSNKTDLTLYTNLIVPVDKTEDYDKLITQFKWEEEGKVELTQREFNQYVHDETDWAVSAKFANMSYIS